MMLDGFMMVYVIVQLGSRYVYIFIHIILLYMYVS